MVVSVVCARPAMAMAITQFDTMAAQDRQDFLNFLERSAEKVLIDQGRTADATKVHQLFNDIHAGSKMSLGEGEFEMNLANARLRDAEKHAQDHNAPPVQVESALALTLSKNGIELTPDFVKGLVQMAATFKPKFPAQRKN